MTSTILPITFLIFAFFFILERSFPGWKLPKIKTWPFRAILLNLAQLGVVFLAGITWENWVNGLSVWHLKEVTATWSGGATAYVISTFVFYWWHRARHRSDFLWRVFHQVHHSPQRLEVSTSFYKHPLEMITNSMISAVLVYPILGLSPHQAAIYTFLTAIGEFFYHSNLKTPQWVGLIFQRPEMHRIHHEFQNHTSNFADIVWWDMLFGTYKNPKDFQGTCGFDQTKEEHLLDMLAWDDIKG